MLETRYRSGNELHIIRWEPNNAVQLMHALDEWSRSPAYEFGSLDYLEMSRDVSRVLQLLANFTKTTP